MSSEGRERVWPRRDVYSRRPPRSERDALPPEHQKLIADSIPGAELLTVSPGAHLANLEQPLRVTGALLGHFDAAGLGRSDTAAGGTR